MSAPRTPSLFALVERLFQSSLMRFGVVGVSNTVIGYSVFRLAHRAAPAAGAQVLSYLVGMLWSYYWNRRWTFRSQSKVTGEAARFFSLQIAFMLLSSASLGLLVDHLHQNPTLSWFAAMVVITVLNFVVSRFWAFKPA